MNKLKVKRPKMSKYVKDTSGHTLNDPKHDQEHHVFAKPFSQNRKLGCLL